MQLVSPSDVDSPAGSPLPSRVLIAEDEHLVATDLSKQVASLGMTVVGPTASLTEAIALARTHKPDLALLDIRMPDGDGLTATTTLQEELGVPVVLVSAYSDEEYVSRGAELAVFGYLVKPVSPEQLRAAIAVAWAAYRQRRRLGDEVAELKTALADRKLVERAKGLLMEKLGLPEPEAMRTLQKHARNTRRRIADVAAAVIDQGELLS